MWLQMLIIGCFALALSSMAATPEDPIASCQQALVALEEHIRVLQGEADRLREVVKELQEGRYKVIEERNLEELSAEEILLAPITKLKFSTRVQTALDHEGIRTIGQLVAYPRQNFFKYSTRVRNIGFFSPPQIRPSGRGEISRSTINSYAASSIGAGFTLNSIGLSSNNPSALSVSSFRLIVLAI